MNYIELIKRFWELDRIYSFNGNETRLYFYLVEQANCLCWQEWFWHKDELASAYVGMSRDTLRSCRIHPRRKRTAEQNKVRNFST